MRLLVDCGNTALKVAVLGAQGPEDHRRVDPKPTAIAAAIEGASEINVVAVSPTALEALREAWGDAIVPKGTPLPLGANQKPNGWWEVPCGNGRTELHPAAIIRSVHVPKAP